jgi:hypothetical protein
MKIARAILAFVIAVSLAALERRAGTANHVTDAVGAARKERPRPVPPGR